MTPPQLWVGLGLLFWLIPLALHGLALPVRLEVNQRNAHSFWRLFSTIRINIFDDYSGPATAITNFSGSR